MAELRLNTAGAEVLDTPRLRVQLRDVGGRLFLDGFLKDTARDWLEQAIDPTNVNPVVEATIDYNVEKGTVYLNRMDALRRGRGYGVELLGAILQHFRGRGFHDAEGYIENFNLPSRDMVRKLKFEQRRETPEGAYWGLRLGNAENGKKTGDRTGVGLFIPLPRELADLYPDLGDEDKSTPHVTFLYVGDVTADREAEFLKTVDEVFSGMEGPVEAHLLNLDYFSNPDKERRVAVTPVRFSRDLSDLRWRLREALTDAGFEVGDSFPLVYRPHVTLGYLEGLDAVYGGKVPKGHWVFDSIEIWGLPAVHKARFSPPMTRLAAKYEPIREPQPGEPGVYNLTGYHATTLDNWPGIRQKGLIPGGSKPAGQDWMGKYSGKAIYFHLQFPQHELDNGFNPETGEPFLVVIETSIRIPAGYVVPDEEAGGPEDTPEIVRSHGPIAVAMRFPPTEIKALHLQDTPAAREWAKTSRARKVEFHDVGFKEARQAQVTQRHMESMTHRTSVALMKFLSDVARRLGVGEHVYVVGGAVRNFVIDKPIKDIDIVIDSVALRGKDSAWFAKELQLAIPVPTSLVTNQYGVAILTINGDWVVDGDNLKGENIEIANARKESYSEGGYKPDEVEPATIEEDTVRREFTFNTLMWRLKDLAHGPDKAEILDLTGCGLKDLQEGMMKCPRDPDVVFTDDASRMIRAVKFLLKYGFKISPDVEASIRRNKDKIKNIPAPHLSNMIIGLFYEEGYGKEALLTLRDFGLLDVVKEIAQTNRAFREALGNWVDRKADLNFVFDLMDLGMPSGKKLSFLKPHQRDRVREITVQLGAKEAAELVSFMEQPGKLIDMPALIAEFGLKGRDIFQLTEKVREALLADPTLVKRPFKLEEKIREGQGKKALELTTAQVLAQVTRYKRASEITKMFPTEVVLFRKAAEEYARIIADLDALPSIVTNEMRIWALKGDAVHQWNRLSQTADVVIRGLLELKEVPPGQEKKLEMAARLLFGMVRKPKDTRVWWATNQKHIAFILGAIQNWKDKTDGSEQMLKVGPFTVHNTIGLGGAKLEGVKKSIEAAAHAISTIKYPAGFDSKVLYGDIFIVARLRRATILAWYYPAEDKMYVRPFAGLEVTHEIIHELGHRFLHKGSPNREARRAWENLYYDMKKGSYQQVQMPKVGDPMPVPVRGVKTSPKIVDINPLKTTFEAPDAKGQMRKETVSTQTMLKMLADKVVETKFPTSYAATSPDEFFCESVALRAQNTLLPKWAEPFDHIWSGEAEKEHPLGEPIFLASRVARRFMADTFTVNVGDHILYGKWKNKKGIIKSIGKDAKGNPIIVVEPVPKGRKQEKVIQLFRVWKDQAASVAKVAEDYLSRVELSPGRWDEAPSSELDKDQEERVWDLYHLAYGAIGKNLTSIGALKSEFRMLWLIDVDGDETIDAFIAYKDTPAGKKIAVLGSDGTPEAKRAVVAKGISLLKSPGWYAELSGRPAEIMDSMGVPRLDDEAAVRGLLKKDIRWEGDGWYSRDVAGIGAKRKGLYGRPRLVHHVVPEHQPEMTTRVACRWELSRHRVGR